MKKNEAPGADDISASENEETKGTGKGKKILVISEFRDMDNFNKAYAVGDDVSHFSNERVEKIREAGLIK